MEKLLISTPTKNYHAFIGAGIVKDINRLLAKLMPDCTKIMIVTDQTVHDYHIDTLQKYVQSDTEVITFITPSGEEAKTFHVFKDCITFALENGLDRKSAILAFGGGVVGDLAGFVAASYMRGIRFIQIPTTILAHDSAVGGKVAINHPLGKNMVGSFYQPEAVIYDTDFLKTLPQREIRSGFAEVIKHALIADKDFLTYLMEHIHSLEALDSKKISYILKKGMEIKRDIVSKDEKEEGIRAYLNFGHTLGHALEAYTGYGRMTHGEAIMSGMVFSLYISIQYKNLEFPIKKFLQWIETLGYQWKVAHDISFNDLYVLMKRDKKSVSQTPVFVLLSEIGRPLLSKVNNEQLITAFRFVQETNEDR